MPKLNILKRRDSEDQTSESATEPRTAVVDVADPGHTPPTLECTPEEMQQLNGSKEGKDLVAWVKQQYARCKNGRQAEEQQWAANLAFYNGNQYFDVMGSDSINAGKFAPTVAPRNRVRLTVNRIRPMVRTEMARLLSQRPSASVIPATSDDQDLFVAQAAEQVWETVSNRRKLQTHITRAAFWTSITGNGFMKTYWDDAAYDPDAQMQGDVVFGSVSPFEIYVPDLLLEDIEDQVYVLNVYAKPIDWLRTFYGEYLEGVELSPDTKMTSSYLENAFASGPRSGRADADASPDAVLVYEMWIKPGASLKFPNGGMMTVVQNTIVMMSKEYPYSHNEYPFAHIKHIPSGRFYGISTIEDIIPLQRDYNDIRSQVSESRKKMGKPQIMAPKGVLTASRMTNAIGQVIEYKPGFAKPEPLPLQSLPAYIPQEMDRVLLDIEDISGQHQVSKGNTPPGVTAATAIAYLQEKDDSYLVTTYGSIESCTEKVARHTLNLIVDYWDVRRLVRVVGEDGAFDAQLLSGADLVNGTDIRVEPGSAIPYSKAGKQATMMDLMKMGFVPAEEGLELLEIGGVQKLVDKLKNDRRQAQRENIKMKKLTRDDFMMDEYQWMVKTSGMGGEEDDLTIVDPQTGMPIQRPPIVSVHTYDNHQIHIDTHNEFRRSQAFELLSPEIQAAFESHVEMHKTMMQQDMLEQMMSQIPSDGTTAGLMGSEDGSSEMVGEEDAMINDTSNDSMAPLPSDNSELSGSGLEAPEEIY